MAAGNRDEENKLFQARIVGLIRRSRDGEKLTKAEMQVLDLYSGMTKTFEGEALHKEGIKIEAERRKKAAEQEEAKRKRKREEATEKAKAALAKRAKKEADEEESDTEEAPAENEKETMINFGESDEEDEEDEGDTQVKEQPEDVKSIEAKQQDRDNHEIDKFIAAIKPLAKAARQYIMAKSTWEGLVSGTVQRAQMASAAARVGTWTDEFKRVILDRLDNPLADRSEQPRAFVVDVAKWIRTLPEQPTTKEDFMVWIQYDRVFRLPKPEQDDSVDAQLS